MCRDREPVGTSHPLQDNCDRSLVTSLVNRENRYRFEPCLSLRALASPLYFGRNRRRSFQRSSREPLRFLSKNPFNINSNIPYSFPDLTFRSPPRYDVSPPFASLCVINYAISGSMFRYPISDPYRL